MLHHFIKIIHLIIDAHRLQAGADFEAVTGVGERPLTLAIRRDDPEIFADLLAYGANPAVSAPSIWDGIEAASPLEMVRDSNMVRDPSRAARFEEALKRYAPTMVIGE